MHEKYHYNMVGTQEEVLCSVFFILVAFLYMLNKKFLNSSSDDPSFHHFLIY